MRSAAHCATATTMRLWFHPRPRALSSRPPTSLEVPLKYSSNDAEEIVCDDATR